MIALGIPANSNWPLVTLARIIDMVLSFGEGPDRLLRWAQYVQDHPQKCNADALRVSAAILANGAGQDRPRRTIRDFSEPRSDDD